ncbi:uncharacterized protein N7482_006133 [Penicillium canariense]|uniref:J domain-containing protein n=1 Tax=Penicillium canariense TaxID=189055 RepID=A0A9W9LN75_9EURO|nr:uncharacterized protein N7482_006133 [Penicillium canariense]KAJ5167352.1 hypothetical protein N7482_006133 [Penicillium canariense]
MVKADVRRDYYADLGLQPSVEAEDIKKQFRKLDADLNNLALKYHPDRNPGREQEFIAKFQAIQAANEILSDPQQRLKYDTDRLRAGYGKVYGPPKTAPRKAQPSYPAAPPPKPQAPKFPFSNRPHAATNGPSAGAARYATHARAGPQQWQKPQDEAQTRADAFKGFHNMRGQNWRGFDPTSGGTPRQQNAPFGNPKPKSAFEYFKENVKTSPTAAANANSPKKRQGFAPGTAGGDEPMARNTSSYTNNRSERPSSMYFDSAPPPTAKKSAAPQSPPLAQEFERTSRSYATTGGEKTFFASPGLGRSSTTRTPSASFRASNTRTNPPSPDPAQPGRHRSASPKSRRDRSYSFSSTSSDLDDDTEEEVRRPNIFKPKAVPKSRLRPHQKFTDFYQEGDSSPGTGEEPSTRQDTQGQRPSPSAQRPRRTPRFSDYVDLTADSDENKGHNSDSATFAKGAYRPEPPVSTSRPTFTQYPTNPTPSARRGSSNLHKKFSAEDWREHLHTFDFLGATAKTQDSSDPLRKTGVSNTNVRGRTTTRTDSTQSSNSTGAFGLNNPFSHVPGGQPSEPPPQQEPTPFAQAKFSADEWSKQLHHMTWTTAEQPRQPGNTPPPRSPKKPLRPGAKVRSAPQPAKVASEAQEARANVNENSPPGPSEQEPINEEPMDIDEDLRPMPPQAAPVPRNVPAGGPRHTNYPDLSAHAAPAAPSAAQQKSQPPQHKEGSTSQSSVRSPLFDLGNFGNTAPFTSTNSGGIENLGDVHATLPFESRAKAQTTTKQDIRPRDLKLPNPPKRPWAPALVPIHLGSQQMVIPREKWNWYVSAMGTYMHDWNSFNRRMLLHFNARQDAVETGLAPGWISAVGDTARLKMNGVGEDGDDDNSRPRDDAELNELDDLEPGTGKGGFSAYLRGIEEDIQVRKHWEVACEMHRECILDLGRIREWIRNGGKVV